MKMFTSDGLLYVCETCKVINVSLYNNIKYNI